MKRGTICAALMAAATIVAAPAAHTHSADVEFAEWMMSLKQPDNPIASCCGPADQFYVERYEASAVAPGGFRAMVDGEWIEVPAHKVVWDRVNPTGRGVIFLSTRSDFPVTGDKKDAIVFCFVPGAGT
jgi:hypothetical protein